MTDISQKNVSQLPAKSHYLTTNTDLFTFVYVEAKDVLRHQLMIVHFVRTFEESKPRHRYIENRYTSCNRDVNNPVDKYP